MTIAPLYSSNISNGILVTCRYLRPSPNYHHDYYSAWDGHLALGWVEEGVILPKLLLLGLTFFSFESILTLDSVIRVLSILRLNCIYGLLPIIMWLGLSSWVFITLLNGGICADQSRDVDSDFKYCCHQRTLVESLNRYLEDKEAREPESWGFL